MSQLSVEDLNRIKTEVLQSIVDSVPVPRG